MINFRICGIVAALAFILSFLIGLISRTSFPMLLLRPIIFSAIFFGITAFINVMVGHFLPELLEEYVPEGDSEHMLGSRVNIMEGDSEEVPLNYAPEGVSATVPVFMGAQPDDSDEVGDISELASMVRASPLVSSPSTTGSHPSSWSGGEMAEGMDHNDKMRYNAMDGMADFSAKEVKTASGASIPRNMEANIDSEELLPDLDSMAGAFISSSSDEESETPEYTVSAPVARKTSPPTKGSEWAGDFNAKDIAAGLRTVLKKDKEG